MRLQKLIVFEPLKVDGSSFSRCVTRALAFILSVVSVKQWHFLKSEDNPDWLTVEISVLLLRLMGSGPARLGLARLGSARLDSAWLGSVRVGKHAKGQVGNTEENICCYS